jgi:hypothetical protein
MIDDDECGAVDGMRIRKSHMTWPGLQPGPPRTAPNRLSYGTTLTSLLQKKTVGYKYASIAFSFDKKSDVYAGRMTV